VENYPPRSSNRVRGKNMNPKILIVEDDDFSRGAMEKVLQSYCYEAYSCQDGKEAISRLEDDSFDILITDLQMPGMDGFELIRKAKMIQPDLPTILITGFPTEEIQSKAKEERVDGFFFKPVDWDELYLLLGTLLGSGNIRSKDLSSSVRGRRRPFQSGGIVFALVLSILILFDIQPLKAQPSFYPQNESVWRMRGQGVCWQSSDVALTEAQTKALEGLQRDYTVEVIPLRSEMMSLRFELRHLIRDPNVQSKVLFDRQKKVSDLHARLDNLSLSYQMKARSILTKEQLEQLPQDCSLEISPEYEIRTGVGKGPRRGPR
jgi:CheY-like chemotaxis protein